MERNGHNGHAVPLSRDELTARLQEARDTLELKKLQHETRLLESFAGLTGLRWGDFVDPWDAFKDIDGLRAFPLGTRWDHQDGRNRPFVWVDLDLDWIRGQARWLANKNLLAQAAVSRLRDFTVKTGYTYEGKPQRGKEKDAEAVDLARMVDQVVQEFIDLNQWGPRERECVVRSITDGEAFVRSFGQPDDHVTLVRWIEPEQVRQPHSTDPTWTFGVRHNPHDIEDVWEYAVSYYSASEWECVPASEVSHLKRNVWACVKRGLSDFFSTQDSLDGVWKLLRNMVEAGGVQAAIAWIEQFDLANKQGVQDAISDRRDQGRTYFPSPVTLKEVNWTKYEAGSILKVPKGKTYLPPPVPVGASVHISIVQAALRAVGARWAMPEYMISGDASNANYASTLVAGSPFVTAVECEQDAYRRFFLRVIWIAVRHAAAMRRFQRGGRTYTIEEVMRLVDVHATPPAVAIANKREEADIDWGDMDRGVMSKQTRQAKRSLDHDQEKANIAEDPPSPPGGQQQGQGQPQGAMQLPSFESMSREERLALADRLRESVEGEAATGAGFFPRRRPPG